MSSKGTKGVKSMTSRMYTVTICLVCSTVSALTCVKQTMYHKQTCYQERLNIFKILQKKSRAIIYLDQ